MLIRLYGFPIFIKLSLRFIPPTVTLLSFQYRDEILKITINYELTIIILLTRSDKSKITSQ